MSFFETEDVPRRQLQSDLRAVIQYASDNHPRSLQKELGPSEIGHVCARHLALSIMQEPTCNADGDCLPSVFGIGFHTWASDVAIPMWNEHVGYERFIAEERVGEGDGYGRAGSCDIYDNDKYTIIDWKCPGVTRFARYVKHGPSMVYRRQVHTYGRGWKLKGKRVDNVAIMFMPRAGRLSQSHLWMEPYSETTALETAGRIDDIIELCDRLDLEHHPERYALIPAYPHDDCDLCDYWAPFPEGPYQCKGNAGDTPTTGENQ